MNNMPMNNDSFLDELRGDVERERWLHIWQQYRVIILSVIALIIIGTGAHSYWKHATAQKNMELTEGLYQAFTPDSHAKPADAANDLSKFAAEHANTPAAVMAEMQAATLKLQAGDTAGALERLEAVLAVKDMDEGLRAAATLFYVRLGLETKDAAELQGKLQPYLNNKSPFRLQAWETAALLAYKQGNVPLAQEYLNNIVEDNNVQRSERLRAQNLQRVLK